MVAVICFLCLALFLAGAFWYGLRGEPNEPPARGNNLPYPDTVWGHMPTADDIRTEEETPRS